MIKKAQLMRVDNKINIITDIIVVDYNNLISRTVFPVGINCRQVSGFDNITKTLT